MSLKRAHDFEDGACKKIHIKENECSICFDVSKRAGFHCPNTACGVWTCLKPCFATLMTGDFAMACATCHTEITRPQWHLLFPANFITDVMNIKWGQVLYAKEQGQLPQYQPLAVRERLAREIDIEIAIHDDRIQDLELTYLRAKNQLREEKDRRHEKKQRADVLRSIRPAAHHAPTEEITVGASFAAHCLAVNCNGFMNREMVCGLCTKAFCRDCHGPAHNSAATPCDPELLATIALVKQDTKPCPKCGTRISKVSGCYQMYCVVRSCGTFFDWGTGREIVNPTMRHNPHYTELLARGGIALRAGGQEEEDCALGLPQLSRLLQAHDRTLSKMSQSADPRAEALIAFHRSILHLNDNREGDRRTAEEKHRAIGTKFLLESYDTGKPYDRKAYESDLRRIAKEDYAGQERENILGTCTQAGRDVLQNYLVNGNVESLYRQCCTIAELTNAELLATCARYGGLKPKSLFVLDDKKMIFLSFLPPAEAVKDVRPAHVPR
jgi:hypothetical protein